VIAGIDGNVLATEISTTLLRPALLAGAVATLVAATAVLALGRRRPGVVGLPIALAALFTLREQLGAASAPLLVFGAAIVMFLVGEAAARAANPVWWYAPALGGVMMAITNIPSVPILGRLGAALGAVVTGVALADFDKRHASQGLGVLLAVITCSAPIFLAPGSDAGVAVGGAAVFMLLLVFPMPWARVGAGGACALAVAFWWAVVISAGWPQGGDNLVGAMVACGFLLFEPPARYFLHRMSGLQTRLRSTRDSVVLVVVTAATAQIALVAYGSAVVARYSRLDLALLSALPAVVLATVAAVEVVPSPRRQSRRAERTS
jgi:hypothetical protein